MKKRLTVTNHSDKDLILIIEILADRYIVPSRGQLEVRFHIEPDPDVAFYVNEGDLIVYGFPYEEYEVYCDGVKLEAHWE